MRNPEKVAELRKISHSPPLEEAPKSLSQLLITPLSGINS